MATLDTITIVQIIIAVLSMLCAISIFLCYLFFKNTKKNYYIKRLKTGPVLRMIPLSR